MTRTHHPDLAALMEPVAKILLGDPNASLSSASELRYGTRGSMSIDLKKGVWRDHESGAGGGVLDLVERETGRKDKARFEWLEENGLIDKHAKPNGSQKANGKLRNGASLGKIVKTYPYVDAAGRLLFEVVRYDPKDFRQRRPDGRGGWIWKLGGGARVPYRLPELIEDLKQKRTIYIFEGEKDCDNAREQLGVAATCNPMGAGYWTPELSAFFKGADCVVVADNDPQKKHPKTGEPMFHKDGRPALPGQDHAQDVAHHLSDVAARVRVLDLKKAWPECPSKGDISNWIEAGHAREEFDTLIENASEYSVPIIHVIDGQIARTVDAAESALLARGVPVMARAGALVQPVVDKLPTSGGRTTQVTLLRALRRENIVYLLNKAGVVFLKYDVRSKEWEEIDPPSEVAGSLLAKGQWQLPRVAGIITVPTVRPDGTILNRPGYDPATQLWYAADSNFAMPEVSDQPTREEAEQALKLLEGLLTGFPFVADVDCSVALAAMLTAILRGAFDVAPMTLVIAHEPGSGKTFLVNLISNMVRGQDCPVITACKSVEEMEKRLGALLLEGAPIINLDNASDNIGGDLLCQITEQRIVRIRILGRSEVPQCEWRGIMFATGNNVALVGDMTRRGLICNIDPKVERPELREFEFNPIEQVLADRGTYVAAALTIARAYLAAGCSTTCKSLASYGAWSKAVREPLVWLGKGDPVTSMEQAREADPVRNAARTLVALWKEHLQSVGYSAADLIEEVNKQKLVSEENDVKIYEFSFPDFRDLLMEQAGTPRGGIEPRRLGNWLMSIRGQVHNGHWIKLVKESARGHRYALEQAPEKDTAPGKDTARRVG